MATSIKTLRDQLTREGNQVYIFTTTDPHVDKQHYEKNIFRFTSIPFISFTDRRIAIRGLFKAYRIAKRLNLDIIHTQTEFSMGVIGRFVAKKLNIPCLHTYHTMYEDYLHYVANGHLLKPVHVKEGTLAFCHHLDGVVAPSKRVLDKLVSYGVQSPIRVIPTGIDVNHYQHAPKVDLRPKLGFKPDTPILLSVSRLAQEKNLGTMLSAMPQIIKRVPSVQLVIVGDGPVREALKNQVKRMHLNQHVTFVGQIDNDKVYQYYQMANVFVSTSNSESQGLTYIEALATGLKVVVVRGAYTEDLLNQKTLGMTFRGIPEYVQDVVEYLKHPERYVLKDHAFLKRKLNAISAHHFVEQIQNFYRSAQVYHDQKS